MNKIIIATILLLFMYNNNLSSQVALRPEIGGSYMPFTLYGANTKNVSSRIDALIGLSAQLPIHKIWFINTRIIYTNRENIKWRDLCTCPGYLYNEFSHWDMNFDFLVNIDKFSLGIDIVTYSSNLKKET